MSLSFGTPALLWGALLVGVPILIHFLNRRRYVVVPFAAMRFLLDAYQKRRKRLRLENLLLLLLRCAAVMLAAMAMALPFVPTDSILAELTGGRRELVLIVDRSASMGRTLSPGVTLDDRVGEMIRRRVQKLSDERGDAVTLITPGGGDMLPAPIGAQPGRVLEVLDQGLPAPSGVADMVGAARVLRDRVRPVRAGRLEVEIYTDMQELSWAGGMESLGGLLQEVFDLGGGSLRVVPVVDETRDVRNLGVEQLLSEDPLLLARDPVTFTAVVRNYDELAQIGIEGSFYQGDELRKVVRLDEIPPRGAATVSFRTRLDAGGAEHVRFELKGDDLPFDDQRTLALAVRDGIDVLLVDGRPGGALAFEGATGYLSLALDPEADEGGNPRFKPTVWSAARLEEARSELWGFDAIVLADVGGMTRSTAAVLAEVVSAGTPLLVFTGESVQGDLYEESLGAAGLLPARIGPALGDAAGAGNIDYVTMVLPDPAPPPMALFADSRLSVLLQVPVLRRHSLEPREDSVVVASFVDALGTTTPALVEGRLGRGRILLVGTSADDTWTLWPRNPATWVPLVHELLTALVADDPADMNLAVGTTPEVIVDGTPVEATLQSPGGELQTFGKPVFEGLGASGERSRLTLADAPLDEAGAWELSVRVVGPEEPLQVLALAGLPDAREGDLATIDTNTLGQLLDGVDYVLGEPLDESDLSDLGDEGDGSLARFLLWALLVALVGESILARSMGSSR